MSTFKRISQWFTPSPGNASSKTDTSPPDSHPGSWAERQAAHYLQQQGLLVTAHNYRCKLGEIDLIMREGEVLVFVEVRSRKYNRFGSAIETVDRRKQRKLILAARHYLHMNKLTERVVCRFDVIGVTPARAGQAAEITWVRNAFSGF